MRLVWLTDIHLNFLNIEERSQFYQRIIEASGDAILISGDIAEAQSVANLLKEMAAEIQQPIYFVLGNHDYYGGQVDEVRTEMITLTQSETLLHWLSMGHAHLLNNETVLVGQDGWADGRYGDYTNSRVRLNDSQMIADLFQQSVVGKYALLEKMQQLADHDAEQLKDMLIQSINHYQPNKIIVLTHVPPFKESCMHEGQISGDGWLPYFASKATGDVLMDVAKNNPEVMFHVLCGHTHSRANYRPFENLQVEAGQAKYYYPEVQTVIHLKHTGDLSHDRQ